MTHDPTHLELEPLFAALARHEIRYVITGSVAALAHGVDVHPCDLDIAPELTQENLGSVADMLSDLRAKPKHVPSWQEGPSRAACDAWLPQPATETNLDHRFVTAHGELDVVPRLAGTYDSLVMRAVTMTAFDIRILVAHVDDLISLCERWDRETDRRRLPLLLAVREGSGRALEVSDMGMRLRRRDRP